MEDDLDFCYLIESTLSQEEGIELLCCCNGREEAVGRAKHLKPDIVLMDLNLSSTEMDGIAAAREIRLATDAKVIILTAFENPDTVIDASVRSFAAGYVFKSQFTSLAEVIRETAAGGTPQEYLIRSVTLSVLSPAERSVFDMLMGKPIRLLSSEKTISNQKTVLLKKLGLKSQKELLHIFRGMSGGA